MRIKHVFGSAMMKRKRAELFFLLFFQKKEEKAVAIDLQEQAIGRAEAIIAV